MNVPEICQAIQALQRRRVAVMKAQLGLNNQSSAFVRRELGWNRDLPEKDRKRIETLALKIVKAVANEEPPEQVCELHEGIEDVVEAVYIFCHGCTLAQEPFCVQRKACEKAMQALAQELPVWAFVVGVKGFGALGLSIIVGEAGDLDNYANPAKLWKRLGLAVFGGKSQRKCKDKASAIEQGYSPRRRSAMWTLGDSLIKGNGDGGYRTMYLDRKAYEHDRATDMTKMHAHRRAQRYMEKALLKHLWKAWRRDENSGEGVLV